MYPEPPALPTFHAAHRKRGMLVASVLVFLLAACALSGCGGSSRTEYERDVAKVGRAVDAALDELPEGDGATLSAEQVAELAGDLRDAADQLDELDPPDDASKAHARLVRGLRGVATAFDRLARDLREARGDDERAQRFVAFTTDREVDKAFDDVATAQELYAAEGYRVFPSGATPAAPPAAGDG